MIRLPPSPRDHRRTRVLLHRLRRDLVAALPLAPFLAADPTLGERIDTTPHDHLAAAALVAIGHLLEALDDLGHPSVVTTRSR